MKSTTRKLASLFLTPLALGIALLANHARAQQTAPAPASASASAPLTVEERLSRLEAEVSALRQENRQLRAQIGTSSTTTTTTAVAPASAPAVAPATPALVSVKPAASEQWISVGGFIMAQAEAGDQIDSRFNAGSSNDRIYLRRARIVLGGHFAENFDFKVSAEMGGALGGKTGMSGALADGFISWTKLPALNVTIGQFKSGFGYEFLYNDTATYAIEHALVTDTLTLNRQIGAQASGALLNSRLTYALGVFNGNATNTSANDNNEFLYTARLAAAPVKTKIPTLGWDAVWNIGVNAYRSNDATVTMPDGTPAPGFPGRGRRTGLGVDTQLALGPCSLWFEYLTTEFAPANPAFATNKVTANGWYLLGEYTIVPKKWQALVRYDTYNPNTDLPRLSTDAWTLGVNYLIKGDDLKLMLNYTTSTPANAARANRVLLRVQTVF